MSRSGYNDYDGDNWDLIRWRGAVTSAIKGRRGQAFLKEMLAVLDAMPEKRLASDELEHQGEVCALGAVGRARQIDMSKIDPHDPPQVAPAFGISEALAREIVYVNDEGCWGVDTPEKRFERVRTWVVSQIR
jgi:hypothetical protein